MSNTEPSTDQPISTVDDLASSLAQNVVISSSDKEKISSSTCLDSNSTAQVKSDVELEVKKATIESDIKPSNDNDFHLIKWIEFNFERLPILLQNINGPCPLLAIFNILLLRKRVKNCFVFKKKFIYLT
jgi:hypothetical protein